MLLGNCQEQIKKVNTVENLLEESSHLKQAQHNTVAQLAHYKTHRRIVIQTAKEAKRSFSIS